MQNDEDAPYTASFQALEQPDIAFLLSYWLDRRQKDFPPLRGSMDPGDFPHLLPRIAVMEVVPEAKRFRFRYRLTGSEIVTRIGRDPTGYFFEDIYFGEDLAETQRLYNHLRQTGRAYASHARYFVGKTKDNLLIYDRLILPLRSRADILSVDQFMLLIVVVDQTGSFQPVGSFWQPKR